MFDDTYVECLVSRKPSIIMRFLYFLLLMLTVFFFLIGLTPHYVVLMAAAAGTGVLCYLAKMRTVVEFEYLYCDKEISIDKILNKCKRKKVGTFEIDKMEIFAPVNSYHLDEYRKRTVKEYDYSTAAASQPEKRYAMYYNGDSKIILEPNEELIKAIRNVAPRKVFTD